MPVTRDRKANRGESPKRNPAIDSVRGLAIVLMIVDHIAVLLFDIAVGTDNPRLATRLSLPLFAIVMGSLLKEKRGTESASPQNRWLGKATPGQWRRFGQLLAASLAANVLFFPYFGRLDILASFCVVYLAFAVLGDRLIWLTGAIVLFPVDPSVGIFDYPLSVVFCLVGLGMILRDRGPLPAVGVALGITFFCIAIVPTPLLYVGFFVIPATLVVALARTGNELSNPALSFVGRYPLNIYVVQYYVLFLIRQFWVGY